MASYSVSLDRELNEKAILRAKQLGFVEDGTVKVEDYLRHLLRSDTEEGRMVVSGEEKQKKRKEKKKEE